MGLSLSYLQVKIYVQDMPECGNFNIAFCIVGLARFNLKGPLLLHKMLLNESAAQECTGLNNEHKSGYFMRWKRAEK